MPDYWTILEEPSQLAKVMQASNSQPQLIYKHSHRCATCFFTKRQVEEVADLIVKKADLYFVDVIGSRPISNTIADKLDVRHESPQIILLSDKKVLWHKSHGEIKSESILAALNEVG